MPVNYNQKGYVGQSMSVRAKQAYENGEKPLSKWTKQEIILAMEENDYSQKLIDKARTMSLNELKEKALEYSSWHHTGKFANSTNFYSLKDEEDLEELLFYNREEEKQRYLKSNEEHANKVRMLLEQRAKNDKVEFDWKGSIIKSNNGEYVVSYALNGVDKYGHNDLIKKVVEEHNSNLNDSIKRGKKNMKKFILDTRRMRDDNPLKELNTNIIEFPNGDYVYVGYDEKTDTLYAGSATNSGISRDVEMFYDKDLSLYENLESLYEMLITEKPERMEEMQDSAKKPNKVSKKHDSKKLKDMDSTAYFKSVNCYSPEDKPGYGSFCLVDEDCELVDHLKRYEKEEILNQLIKGRSQFSVNGEEYEIEFAGDCEWEEAQPQILKMFNQGQLKGVFKVNAKKHDSKYSQKELEDIVMSDYGMTRKEAKEYLKKANDKQKENLVKGFKQNAKMSFREDSKAKKTKDVDWSYKYELVDVGFDYGSLRLRKVREWGGNRLVNSKEIEGNCELIGKETRYNKTEEVIDGATFIWYVPEDRVKIYVYDKKIFSNSDIRKAEKILLDNLKTNVNPNDYLTNDSSCKRKDRKPMRKHVLKRDKRLHR